MPLDYTFWPNMDCGFGPYPGGPVALNRHGHLCLGWSSCGEPVDMTAIWYGSGNPIILPIPPGYRAMKPEDMNDLGEIVGTLQLPTGPFRPFLRTSNGQIIDLGLPSGATVAHGLGINNKSEVVGYSSGPNGNRAFIWKDGAFTHLELPIGPYSQALAINDSSQITGWMGDLPNSFAFLCNNGQADATGPVTGGFSAVGTAISPSGSVAGYGLIANGPQTLKHSFFYQSGGLTDLGTLPGFQSSRAGKCNDSVVMGRAEDGVDLPCVFVWSNGEIRKLSDLVPIADLRIPSTGTIATDGRIAVAGRIGDGWFGLILTPHGPFQGDVNSDCVVNVPDLLAVIDNWGLCVPKSPCPADINHDANVDVWDIVLVVQNWGSH